MGITLDAALGKVNAHLKACPFTSKDRIDLEALEKHCGRRYAQPETVPAEIWSSLRAMHGIDCVVLLPPDSADGGRTSVGSDGIICLSDSVAALKGLPVNMRAKALLTACGRTREIQGDVFVGRVAAEWGKDNTLRGSMGGETPPQLLVERDWLEKAQRYSSSAALEKAPGASAFESMLLSHLQLIRQQEIAAAIAEAKAKAAREGGGPTTGGPSEEALHGAGAGTLSWTDGKTDITVTVLVPASTKSKDVRCSIRDEWLRIEVLTLPEGRTVVVDQKLFQAVKASDCEWFLEDAPRQTDASVRALTITLEKKKPMKWLVLTRND